jgi:hypothetical protein
MPFEHVLQLVLDIVVVRLLFELKPLAVAEDGVELA